MKKNEPDLWQERPHKSNESDWNGDTWPEPSNEICSDNRNQYEPDPSQEISHKSIESEEQPDTQDISNTSQVIPTDQQDPIPIPEPVPVDQSESIEIEKPVSKKRRNRMEQLTREDRRRKNLRTKKPDVLPRMLDKYAKKKIAKKRIIQEGLDYKWGEADYRSLENLRMAEIIKMEEIEERKRLKEKMKRSNPISTFVLNIFPNTSFGNSILLSLPEHSNEVL